MYKDISDERGLLNEDREANIATAISVLSTLVIVTISFLYSFYIKTSLYMIVGGLILQFTMNVLGLILVVPATKGKLWAIFLVSIFYRLVPFPIALYMAGILVLLMKSISLCFSYLF